MFIGKHIFIIFLSLFVIRNFRSVVLKAGGITPLGAILRGIGEIGGEKHKKGKRSTKSIEKHSHTSPESYLFKVAAV